MTRIEIEDRVALMVEPLVVAAGMELVDVEYVQEREWYLRVFIDKAGGVGIEDCEQISRMVEPLLDEVDFLKQAYYLEVSSPGLDRVLRRDKDYLRYAGRTVDIKFFRPFNGNKQLTVELLGLVDGKVCVKNEKVEYSFPQDEIAQIRLHVEIGKSKK